MDDRGIPNNILGDDPPLEMPPPQIFYVWEMLQIHVFQFLRALRAASILKIHDWSFLFVTLPGAKILKNRDFLKIHDLSFLFVTLPGAKILKKNMIFLYFKVFQRSPKTSFGAQKRYFLKDLSFGTMLKRLVLKNPI